MGGGAVGAAGGLAPYGGGGMPMDGGAAGFRML